MEPSISKEPDHMWIDSHCHLHYFKDDEIAQIDSLCSKNSLTVLLTNSTCSADFERTLSLQKLCTHTQVLPGLGFHPWYLDEPMTNPDWFADFQKRISDLISSKENFFIGEIGIDGGKVKKKFPLPKQIEIFQRQLEFANDLEKLVTIHCVYEWDKLYKILSQAKIGNLTTGKIILHSFQGGPKHIEQFNKFNVWYSISPGCVSDKNKEMLTHLPLDRVLLESDSPSMFNKEIYDDESEYNFYFKEKNHPMSVIPLAKKLSLIKGIDYKIFISQVFKNNKNLISLLK